MRAGPVAGSTLATIAAILVLAVPGTNAMPAHAAGMAVLNCGSASVGPTAIGGKSAGALCLLHAYQGNCRPAFYSISRFGVDTIARDTFRLVQVQGRCRINVTASFSVVPQKPHAVGSGQCSTLVRLGTDIVARHCVGKGITASISLTGATLTAVGAVDSRGSPPARHCLFTRIG